MSDRSHVALSFLARRRHILPQRKQHLTLQIPRIVASDICMQVKEFQKRIHDVLNVGQLEYPRWIIWINWVFHFSEMIY